MTHLRNKFSKSNEWLSTLYGWSLRHCWEHMSTFYGTDFANELDDSLALKIDVMIVGQRKGRPVLSIIEHSKIVLSNVGLTVVTLTMTPVKMENFWCTMMCWPPVGMDFITTTFAWSCLFIWPTQIWCITHDVGEECRNVSFLGAQGRHHRANSLPLMVERPAETTSLAPFSFSGRLALIYCIIRPWRWCFLLLLIITSCTVPARWTNLQRAFYALAVMS